MTTATTTASPRIYVTNLAAYNAGRLIGQWVDVDSTIDDMIGTLLEEWKVEEWFASDSEGLPSVFGEFPSITDLETYAEVFEANAMRDDFATVLAAYVDEYGLDELDSLDDRDRGEWISFQEFANELADDVYHEAMETAASTPYLQFDYELFARDLLMDGFTVIDLPGGVHVFEDNV